MALITDERQRPIPLRRWLPPRWSLLPHPPRGHDSETRDRSHDDRGSGHTNGRDLALGVRLRGDPGQVPEAGWARDRQDCLSTSSQGAAFHMVALFGFARDYSSLLHALGDGALATFLATTGYRVGERWGSGTKGFLSAVSGAFVGEDDKPVSGGSSVADQELHRLARG